MAAIVGYLGPELSRQMANWAMVGGVAGLGAELLTDSNYSPFTRDGTPPARGFFLVAGLVLPAAFRAFSWYIGFGAAVGAIVGGMVAVSQISPRALMSHKIQHIAGGILLGGVIGYLGGFLDFGSVPVVFTIPLR